MPEACETDEPHRDLWLSMAERWLYLALKESVTLGNKGGLPEAGDRSSAIGTSARLLHNLT